MSYLLSYLASLVTQMVNKLPAMQETVRSLGWEDPLETQIGCPLQYYCLENSLDRGDWLTTVHGIPKSQTQLSN